MSSVISPDFRSPVDIRERRGTPKAAEAELCSLVRLPKRMRTVRAQVPVRWRAICVNHTVGSSITG